MKKETQTVQLPNGLRVTCTPVPGAASVAMGIWVATGSRYERADENGAAHFLEHVLFKGTKTRTAKQISEAIEGRGGFFDAFTDSDATCLQARVLAGHAKGVFEILADVVTQPRFSRMDIEREREVIEEEIRMYMDDPQAVAESQMAKGLWWRHPLGAPIEGTLRSVAGLNRSALQSFWKRYYVPQNMVVSFAGKISMEDGVEWASQFLAHGGGEPPPEFVRVTDKTSRRPLQVLHKPVEQVHLALGYRIPGRHAADKYAMRLLAVLLGGNMSSRLFQNIRERHGLAYAIHSGVNYYDEVGNMFITAAVEKKNAPRTLSMILKELFKIRKTSISPVEFQRAKEYVVGQFRIGLENVMAQMNWAGEAELYYRRRLSPKEEIQAIEQVAAEDIQRLACEYLNPHQLTLGIVTPRRVIDDEIWLKVVSEQG